MAGVSTTSLVALLALITGAYYVGAMMGFGTTLLLVTFASQFIPMDTLLPVVMPLNIALGSYIAWRHRHHTQWRTMLTNVLPLVALGIPAGLALFQWRDVVWLKIGFGLFVTLLAALQLRVAYADAHVTQQPLGKLQSAAVLTFGGLIHGLYATAGPVIVYVLARRIVDKSEFRSTTATLFLLLTWVLQIEYARTGLVTGDVLKIVAMGLPAMALGIWLGERTFGRLDTQKFRRALWLLLLVGGIILTIRAILKL